MIKFHRKNKFRNINANMKKILLSSLLITLLLFSACTQNKYIIDISDMPEEVKQNHEDLLKQHLEKYNESNDPGEKALLAEEIGFRYMNLGNYEKAIFYYNEVLQEYPSYYQALNNLAYMYEEVEEIAKALEYQQKLYENDSTNMQILSGVIRLLVKNNQSDDALSVLEVFARTDIGMENKKFVSDQFEYIKNKL